MYLVTTNYPMVLPKDVIGPHLWTPFNPSIPIGASLFGAHPFCNSEFEPHHRSPTKNLYETLLFPWRSDPPHETSFSSTPPRQATYLESSDSHFLPPHPTLPVPLYYYHPFLACSNAFCGPTMPLIDQLVPQKTFHLPFCSSRNSDASSLLTKIGPARTLDVQPAQWTVSFDRIANPIHVPF